MIETSKQMREREENIQTIIKAETVMDLKRQIEILYSGLDEVNRKLEIVTTRHNDITDKVWKLEKDKEYYDICLSTVEMYGEVYTVDNLEDRLKKIDMDMTPLLPELEMANYVISILEQKKRSMEKNKEALNVQLDALLGKVAEPKLKKRRKVFSRKNKRTIGMLCGLACTVISYLYMNEIPYDVSSGLLFGGATLFFYSIFHYKKKHRIRW